MNPARTDVQLRRKKHIRCKNSSWLGFSSSKLRPGDFFVYSVPDENSADQRYFARCHGQINTLTQPLKKWIFAQVIFPRHTFTGERWVDPDWVVEVVPKERASLNLIALFEELEDNQ